MRDEQDELLLLYAAGALEEAEAVVVEARLASGDPGVQAAYAEALAVVHSLPLALEPKQPSKSVRQNLLARALVSNQSPASAPARSIWPIWITTGVAAVLAVGLALTWIQNRQISTELASQIKQADETRRVLSMPTVHFTKLAVQGQSDAKDQPIGRLAYCTVSNQYQLRVYSMKPPPPGRVYELWLITPGGTTKVPAGTFTVDASGSATHYIHFPQSAQYALAAITDEPSGGSRQPTGPIHLLGDLNAQ